jgi:hypothetical protein
VRIKRDRAFWAALLPHLWEFWFHNVIPARQALQRYLLKLEAEGQRSEHERGYSTAAVNAATSDLQVEEAVECMGGGESDEELLTGSALSMKSLLSGKVDKEDVVLTEAALKKLRRKQKKEANDILKAVVRYTVWSS